jgi:hypothetical protein
MNSQNKEKELIQRGFFYMGFQYLHVVRELAEENIKTDNSTGDFYWGNKSRDEQIRRLNYNSRWSDVNIVSPLLFCLYHGIELSLKGFLFGKEKVESKHKSTVLLEKFLYHYPNEADIIGFFEKYLFPSDHLKKPNILDDFLTSNKIGPEKLYASLRYPTDNEFANIIEHTCLKYQGIAGVPFYEELFENINTSIHKMWKLAELLTPSRLQAELDALTEEDIEVIRNSPLE